MMESERRARRFGWVPLALGAAGLATGLVIGGAWAVKDVEISSEWEIDAPAEQVFELLLDRRSYAEWWPEMAGHVNTNGRYITASTVVQCAARVPVGFLPFLPAVRVTLRFPQIERNQRIRVRLTGDVTGIAEWVIIPQGNVSPTVEGTRVLLKNNTRLRLTNPLLNLAALALPESAWRPTLERMLLEARAGLRHRLEVADAEFALAGH